LFVGSDSTEDDFCEALRWKHTEANSADHSVFLDETKRFVFSVHDNVSSIAADQTQDELQRCLTS